MNNVIVFAGSAIGSVLALAEEIKLSHNVIVTVVCLNCTKEDIFAKSKYIDETLTLTFKEPEEFFNKFKEWTLKEKFVRKPISYFTTDSSCYLVNQYRNWFENNYMLVLPSSAIINTYTQKGRAEIAAQNNGLLCPKSKVIRSREDILFVQREFDFPVIIKPLATYDKKRAPFKTRTLSENEFITILPELLKDEYNVICQEYIPGDDEKAFFYLFNRSKIGEINQVLGRKVIQNPPQAGIMAKGIVEKNERLSLICSDFLNRIDYVGIGGIEFKEYQGSYYFIEMSTRLEGFFKIGFLSGMPLGRIAYEQLMSEQPSGEYTTKDNTTYIDFFALIFSLKKQGKYFTLLKELLSILFFNRKNLNVYSENDKKPFFTLIKSNLQ